MSAAFQMWMISSGSAPGQVNQNTVIVTIRKSQRCELYFHAIKHRICFFIKLNQLALKDDNNHCGSVMLRKWNDQHIFWLVTCKRMDRTFNFWYFAGYTVHIIPV